MLGINLAEVAEVVLANEVGCSFLHGCNIQLAMLDNVVGVLTMPGAEPEGRQTEGCRSREIQYVRLQNDILRLRMCTALLAGKSYLMMVHVNQVPCMPLAVPEGEQTSLMPLLHQ